MNTTVGFVLILALLFLVPNTVPNLVGRYLPNFASTLSSCSQLRRSDNRGFHQSLIARGVTAPFALTVSASSLPQPNNATGDFYVFITVTNVSNGTMPIVYDPLEVVVGDNGTSGLGVIFTPANGLTSGFRSEPAAFSDADIRLIGPRQRCIHTLVFPAGNVIVDGALMSGQTAVRAFYRGVSAGAVTQNGIATPIFRDLGLWVGYTESLPVQIPPPLNLSP
jgi:hypothetical protein